MNLYYAITPRDYEKQAGNMQEFRRYSKGLRGIVVYYMEVTKPLVWDAEDESERVKALKPSTEVTYEPNPSLFEKLKWWK